jgi:uracil-DNA glycosylase family 4
VKLEDCRSCKRLVSHLKKVRRKHPEWHNLPVPGIGPKSSKLLILGLAPGMNGANRTGKPFYGDRSSEWLQNRLIEAGCMDSEGNILGVRISNAVKCLPPGNKPTGEEIRRCSSRWLIDELKTPTVVLALGRVAHDAVLRTLGHTLKRFPFAQGAVHELDSLHLVDSYHPSPLNTQTGRLSPVQFNHALRTAINATQAIDELAGTE